MILRALVLSMIFGVSAVSANERHIGYYYPEITSSEVFDRVIRRPGSNKSVRVDFLTTLTQSQLAAPETPRFIFSAKGEGARDLILVALDDEVFRSLYRARAVLAQLTSSIRSSPLIVQQDLQTVATFFDLLQMLEFDSLVITDGTSWSHRVDFKRD